MSERHVVVTGIGVLTGLGEGPERLWSGLMEGRSAVAPIRAYDTAPLQSRLGAELVDFDPLAHMSRRTLRTVNRGDQIAVAAAALAVEDAGLEPGRDLGERAGLYLGGNKEISRLGPLIENLGATRAADGTCDMGVLGREADTIVPPLFFVEGLQPAAMFHISQIHGIRGASAFFAGTGDSGTAAVGRAMRAVRRGEADIALTGGYDDACSWWSMAKFDPLGVLTTRDDLGARAFRPYDRDRSGAVLGEGGAILVLEEEERARARGARVYARVTGYGAGNDMARPPRPDDSGLGVTVSIRKALRDARLPAEDISVTLGHGSATARGDLSEARGVREGLASASGAAPRLACIKPQTGHLVGGSGALNVAVGALSLAEQALPTTRTLERADPALGSAAEIDLLAGDPRETSVDAVLALGRGIEGQSTTIVLRRPA